MYRYFLAAFFIVASIGSLQSPPSNEEIKSTLERAEAFYYEARFKDAIDLLVPLDRAMQGQTGRVSERISIKLQLAVAHIGMNQTAEAKLLFGDLNDLDPKYSLDAQQFAPKIITLFQEARAERSQSRCLTYCAQADQDVKNGKGEEIISSLEDQEGCACISPIALTAAERVYKEGLEAYRQDRFPEALKKLRLVLTVDPQNELANQYIELIQSKVGVATERILLEWRHQLETRDFTKASASYRQLLPLSFDEKAAQALREMSVEYRAALSTVVTSWTRACAANDAAAMTTLRTQANQILPDATIGQDLLDQTNTCAVQGCLQLMSQSAMTRIKTRVNPTLPSSLRPAVPMTLRVKVKIDEAGSVTVNSIEGGNPAINGPVRTAFEQWKFTPALVDEKARCVETELPILLN